MKLTPTKLIKRTGLAVAAGLVAAGSLLYGGTDVHAGDLEVYDQGEHLSFPEGPIHQDGVWMVPLRPIAERFGYAITKAMPQEAQLAGGAMGSVTLHPGQPAVLVNGSVKRTYQAAPRYIHGTLFAPLDFIGDLTGIGYSVMAGPAKNPSAIELRPGDENAETLLDKQYWTGVNVGYGKTLYLNGKGEAVQTIQTSDASSFGYGELAPMYKNGFGQGYMDRSGQLAVGASHYRIGSFSEGMAVYKDLYPFDSTSYQVKYGYVNRAGLNMTYPGGTPVPMLFSKAFPFSDGLAKVVQGDKTFYIDHNGVTAIPPIAGSLHTGSFSNGLASVEMRMRIDGKLTARIGFIDTKGRFVIPPTFTWVDDFADNGLSAALKDGKFGYIDAAGKWVIAPEFDSAERFSENFAVVKTTTANGTVFSLIDAGGNKLKLPPHQALGRVSQGLIAFESDGLWGYAGTDGAVVVEPQFEWVSGFEGGLASVRLKEDGNKLRDAYIDKSGKVVWKSESTY